jgi:hypothetical protein
MGFPLSHNGAAAPLEPIKVVEKKNELHPQDIPAILIFRFIAPLLGIGVVLSR